MPIDRLLNIMRRLRDPNGGCPWDLEQNFRTIAPYTIEEAYEVADAIERNDVQELRDELGDLLFQVVFHAQLAREQGLFDFDGVVDAICDKMERRHPHVFGTAQVDSAAEQSIAWEEHKRRERSRKGAAQSVLDGVPVGLPALTRASKLGKRAAQVGFEWPDVQGALDKAAEEIAELRAELTDTPNREALAGEIGDVLFCIVNIARYAKIDPETALRKTNTKFERRFHYVETQLRARGRSPAQATLEEMDALWDEGKALERAPSAPTKQD